MKSHARVVVIGGGVVGVSTLYHLTKKGWSDVVLLERTELTAGSTWHAAGLLPLFNMSYTVGQLHKYSVDLYKRLPAETGQDVSFHVTGNLRLATCRDRMDEYQKYCGTANTIGVPFQVISPAEVKELWPLVEPGWRADTPAIVGALYHPDDGHIAPADLTMALRKGARAAGAEINEQTEVTGAAQTPSGEWQLTTNKGEIIAEHVVLRHRQLRAPDRPHVRAQRAGDSGRTPVHRLRRVARAEGLSRSRAAASSPCCANPTSRITCAKSAWAGSSAPTRPARRRASPMACRMVRQEPVSRRPGSPAAARRSGAAARAGAANVAASRTSSTARSPTRRTAARWSGRPGASAQPLAQRRPQLRHHRRGRLRLAARRVDRRGRARHRHAGGRSASLRSLHEQALRRGEERGNVSRRLHDPLPGRGAPTTRARPRPVPVYDKLEAHGRRVRPALRLGTRQLVCAGRRRAQGRLELPPHQLFRARRQRMPADARAGRRHRPDAVHQARSDGRRAPKPGSTAWSPTRCRPRSAASRCAMRSRSAAASVRNSRSPSSPIITSTS